MDTVEVGEESVAVHSESAAKMCRLCCCENQTDLQLIFSKSSTHELSKLLLKKIFECTTVKITNEGDDQNALICQSCIAKIDDFYAYREQCKANDDRIRHKANENHPQIRIKQEKEFEISITESNAASQDGFNHEESLQPRSSSHSATTTSKEVRVTSKDTDNSLLQPMQSANQSSHAEEITIKREAIEDDDVFYNSDGEVTMERSFGKRSQQPKESPSGDQKSKFQIIMNSNNRERLVYQGYLYCRHFSRRDGSVHWRCRLSGCQAAVNLYTDGIIRRANNADHCHAQNAPQNFDDDNNYESAQIGDGEDDLVTPMENDMSQDIYEDEEFSQEENSLTDLVAVDADSLQIVTNKKKGATLVHLGFKYCKRYLKMDGSTFWKCRSNNNKCTAGVYVYPNSKVRYHGKHNHEKVVSEEGDNDLDYSIDDSMHQPFTIDEDVDEEEDDEGPSEYADDMTDLLTPSVEVHDEKPGGDDYEITTNVKGRECLIFEGHQYSKDRDRADGAILWRCRRNYDKCRAMAIIYPNGKVKSTGVHYHETDKRYLERREQGNGSRFYRITKNQRGNDALVFEGHRFSKEWSRVDGSIIWRCSYKSGICRVKVVLNALGVVHRMGSEHEHDHETTETPVTVEFTERDSETHDDSLITPARNQPKTTPQPSPSISSFSSEHQTSGGFRIIKNRKGFEALVHDGYRYCKVRVKQDGSVKWLCKMNKKTCRASVDLYPDGTILKSSEYDHNHERPNDMDGADDEDETEGMGQDTTYPIDPEVFGNSQWYYVKNSKNGISMIHAGYRYTKKCDRVDGTSLWRCSVSQRGCKAGVILFPNDTLAMVENAEHSHKPYEGTTKPAENETEIEDTPRKSDAVDVHDVDEADEVSWMGGNETESENVWFNTGTDRPYPRPSSGTPNFRIIKNRRNTDSLVHRGYRYCKIRDRQDGSILWACQMNKKTCKASVNLTTDGRVEVINGRHNHVKTDEDDLVDEPSSKPSMIIDDSISDAEYGFDESPEEDRAPNAPAKHPDYYYAMNKSNRAALIHKGYRFSKRYDRPDGSTVWRCSMGGNTCMVVVTIHADGTPTENSIKHNHQPLADLPPEVEPPPPPTPEIQEDTRPIASYDRQGDALEWEGFHYRKIKELPDSSIIWICQVDSCRVAVKMLPGGQLRMLSESEHNHTAPGKLSQAAQISTTQAKPPAPTEGKTRSYRLFKNRKGQMTMLYKGYRYAIRNRNPDGSSCWKCRANGTCGVVIYLMPDDRIILGSNSEHNHDPILEPANKPETAPPPPTRVNPLYDYLNIIPGGSAPKPPQPIVQKVSEPIKKAPVQIPDSSNYGKNVIEYKGYYYRLVVRKKNGREYWRCVHFRTRACRAALFCRDNGNIVTSSNGKDHAHGGGADAHPQPIQTPSLSWKTKKRPGMFLQATTSVQPSPSPTELTHINQGDEERYIDHGEYVIAKNRKDQNTLIYKDRRYYLSYNRSDGSAVWRCAHRKRYKCYAYVRLRPDGRLLSTGEQEHSHSSTAEASSGAVAPANNKQVKNYRIVKNRVGNDILIHDSHRFRLNYQRNDGTSHWRCIWARSNHCSAGVYLFANGMLKNAANETEIIHNHPPPLLAKKTPIPNPVPKPQIQTPVTRVTPEKSRTIVEDDGITDFNFVEEGSNKTLMCRGYRYWYSWIRKDGCIYYRCTEAEQLQCPMGVLLLSNGKLIRANEHCHNHDPLPSQSENLQNTLSGLQVNDNPQLEGGLEHYPPLPVPASGDNDFKIVKTSRGESLIYKGYRYWAKNRLANGIVSLCCTRKKLKRCPAMLRLLTNGRVIDPIGAGHTHPPSQEGGNQSFSAMQPISYTPTHLKQPAPVKQPAKPSLSSPPPPSQRKLPQLSFNEESEDDAEQGDESLIGSRRYVFMKSTSQRNFIVFEGFVYDFEHKQHDGCVFYRCKTNEACPASLMLLTNGRVMNMDDILHIHDKPDLSALRPVGRGSKEFKIVQNKNGNNILVHRGHRYTTPRSKTDGAGIWYCHTFVPSMNRRCYVPIELLPNGRVAPVGEKQHNHAAPFKTKQDTAETKVGTIKSEYNSDVNNSEAKSDNRILLFGGHRYNYVHKREDGAILWKCIRKSCNATMYRMTNGQTIKGPDHNHEKTETTESSSNKRTYSEIATKIKSSSPNASDSDPQPSQTYTPRKYRTRGEPTPPTKNPYIGQSLISEGYRYVYYLTRRDGSEHWRCCRRLPMKCRGGVYKQLDGSLEMSNDEGHTHPPDHASYEDVIPMTTSDPSVEHQDINENEEPEEPAPVVTRTTFANAFVDADGSYDYELVDVKGRKRGYYLVYHKVAFLLVHTRRDRARYYRCKNAGCRAAVLLHKNGLLVQANENTHNCKDGNIKTEDSEQQNATEEPEEEESSEPDSKKQKLEENKQETDGDQELETETVENETAEDNGGVENEADDDTVEVVPEENATENNAIENDSVEDDAVEEDAVEDDAVEDDVDENDVAEDDKKEEEEEISSDKPEEDKSSSNDSESTGEIMLQVKDEPVEAL